MAFKAFWRKDLVTAPTLSRDADDVASQQKDPKRAARKAKADAHRSLITEGNIQRGVIAVAVPSVATMLLQTTNGLLDTFFVGSLGTEAVAAITVSGSLMFALMAAAMAVSVGTTALVARFIGEKADADAVTATRQSIILSVLISVALGIPMFFLRIPLLSALGLGDDALQQASRYLAVTIIGMPFLFMMLILNGAFRGLGDTARPFWVSLLANIVHAAFNYLLIFGHFGFPKLGLAGGATALAISQLIATILYLAFLPKTPLADALRGGWELDWEWAKRIARIGIPASAQQLIRVGSMLAFQALLARSGAGAAAVAALGIGLRSESIAFMPGFGYAIAASAFVGQNLGAGRPDRANAGAWAATLQAVVVMTLMGLLFAVFGEEFARFFIKHVPGETAHQAAQIEETIRLTAAYLHIAVYSEAFLALGMVLTGALQGAGETVSPTAITVISMAVIRLPLSWLLLNWYGPIGAWWAMSISTIIQGVMVVYIFRQGKWHQTKV